MIILFFYVIFIVFTVMGLLLLFYHFVVYPIRTRCFRKHIDRGDRCRFYMDEDKFQGIIRRIIGDRIELEYYDYERMKLGRRSVHRSEIYPLI